MLGPKCELIFELSFFFFFSRSTPQQLHSSWHKRQNHFPLSTRLTRHHGPNLQPRGGHTASPLGVLDAGQPVPAVGGGWANGRRTAAPQVDCADNSVGLSPIPSAVGTTDGVKHAPGHGRVWYRGKHPRRWRPSCCRRSGPAPELPTKDRSVPGLRQTPWGSKRGSTGEKDCPLCRPLPGVVTCHSACEALPKSSTGWCFRSPSPGHVVPSLLPPYYPL